MKHLNEANTTALILQTK